MITGFQLIEDDHPIQGNDVFWNNNEEFNVNELIEYTGEEPENMELSPTTDELLHGIESIICDIYIYRSSPYFQDTSLVH